MHRAWLAPTVFIIAMGVGMVLGTVGFGHVAIEPTIAVSVLVMGMLIAARDTLSLRAALV
ncbi:MAG: urease accessory protein, partial [Betaproteobacteria bacterium]|nr:urease accessory protein [Betaproteobacteria bacterium]